MIGIEIAFGQLIKKHRETKGLSQDQLADLTGVSRVSIANIEGGKQGPSLETALKLTIALEFSLEEIRRQIEDLSIENLIKDSPEEIRADLEQLADEARKARE